MESYQQDKQENPNEAKSNGNPISLGTATFSPKGKESMNLDPKTEEKTNANKQEEKTRTEKNNSDPFKDTKLPNKISPDPSPKESPYVEATGASGGTPITLSNNKEYFFKIEIPPSNVQDIQNALDNPQNEKRVKVIIQDSLQGNSVDIEGLHLPKGGILAFETANGKFCDVNFVACDLQGQVQSLSQGKIATTFVGEDFSKTGRPNSKIVGVVQELTKAINTDVMGTQIIGGIADDLSDSLASKVAKIPVAGWILNKTPSCFGLNPFNKKSQIIKNFKGMIFDKNTKFYPSEKKCFEKFGKKVGFNSLNEVKIIQELVNIEKREASNPNHSSNPKTIKDILSELKQTAKNGNSSTLDNFSSMLADKLGLSEDDVKKFVKDKILNTKDPEKEFSKLKGSLKKYNSLTSEYKKSVNKKIHKLLKHYSGKVKVNSKMSISELNDYLKSDNTFAKINPFTGTLDEKFKKKVNGDVYEINDFDTGRKFLISKDKNGNLIAMLEESAGKDDKLKKEKIFTFKKPSEFLQSYIIENKGMTKEWQKKNGDGYANVIKGYEPNP